MKTTRRRLFALAAVAPFAAAVKELTTNRASILRAMFRFKKGDPGITTWTLHSTVSPELLADTCEAEKMVTDRIAEAFAQYEDVHSICSQRDGSAWWWDEDVEDWLELP